MASKVEIISDAFNLLGKKAIKSIDVNSPEIVRTASALYDRFYEKALTMHPWRFAILIRELNRINVDSPTEDFDFIFQLPGDLLVPYRTEPNVIYEIFEDRLFCNQDTIKLHYVGRVSEENFPPYFTIFLIEKMAEVLAMPVTQQPSLVQLWGQAAEVSFKRATAKDSSSRTTNIILRDKIFDSKFGATDNFRLGPTTL